MQSKKTILSRRKMLAASGVAIAGAVAGCSSDDGEAEASEDDEEDNGDEADNGDQEEENGEDEEDENEGDDEYADGRDDTLELAFGETARTRDGIEFTVGDPEFVDEYESEGASGNTRVQEPDSGYQWAFFDLVGENTSDEELRLPRRTSFTIIIENSQFEYEYYHGEDEVYEGGDVQPGIVREGLILFAIPEDTSAEDMEFTWHDDFLGADINVRWSA